MKNIKLELSHGKLYQVLELFRSPAIATGLAILAALMSFFASTAFGSDKMSMDTHNLVIKKLEMSLAKAKDDETVDLRPVRARLADLYSERARLEEMEDGEKGCTTCTAALNDRKKALHLYDLVLREADPEDRGPLMIQMSHLGVLVDQPEAAEEIYERLIKEGPKKHENKILAQAYAGRAEFKFRHAKYKAAQTDFEVAIRMSSKEHQGPLYLRIAWCYLNRGEQQEAVSRLVKILRDPELLNRASTEGAVYDAAFHEEVATDLGTYLARGPVGEREIQMVASLSPEAARPRTLKHLASETERLGNHKASLATWLAVSGMIQDKSEKLEITIHIARIQYDLGEKSKAQASFEQAIAQWNQVGCTDANACENLRKELRNMVTDWNRAEAKNPSPQLLSVYQAYISHWSNDLEMTAWAALVARQEKKYEEARVLYHKTSQLAAEQSDHKGAKDILETSLVGEIEMAEIVPASPEAYVNREQAYDHYLAMAPKGAIAMKVRYQRARLPYEQGNSDEGSKRLAAFASSPECRELGEKEPLCVQAANLDLDARVLLKNDKLIESGALAYAQIYPSRRAEYLKTARTAGLKQAEVMAPAEAISKLQTVNLSGASKDERVNIIKTRINLAEKSKDLRATRAAANELLKVDHLSSQDREYGYSRLAWAAEMSFDFKLAYDMSRKLKMSQLTPADRAMRLALLAELAGENPRPYQEQFLKLSKDSSRRVQIRAKLVRASKSPVAEFKKQQAELMRYPSIAAPLALEVFARTNNRPFVESVLRNRAIAKQPAGQTLARQLFLGDFNRLDVKVAKHRIRVKTEVEMQHSLSERIRLLHELEVSANRAIKSDDWTSQLVTLAVLSREQIRFYNEIVSLPVPKRLKGADRDAYLKLVDANAKAFQAKHDAIEAKLAPFWANHEALEKMTDDYKAARIEIRPILARELIAIGKVAPSEQIRMINQALGTGAQAVRPSAIASAIRDASQTPFSEGKLQNLRELEMAQGRETMVAYLDARLLKLKENDGEKKR